MNGYWASVGRNESLKEGYFQKNSDAKHNFFKKSSKSFKKASKCFISFKKRRQNESKIAESL